MELEYELFLSYFRASVSVLALARIVTWYDVKVPKTNPADILKQCMSRVMLTVVMESA